MHEAVSRKGKYWKIQHIDVVDRAGVFKTCVDKDIVQNSRDSFAAQYKTCFERKSVMDQFVQEKLKTFQDWKALLESINSNIETSIDISKLRRLNKKESCDLFENLRSNVSVKELIFNRLGLDNQHVNQLVKLPCTNKAMTKIGLSNVGLTDETIIPLLDVLKSKNTTLTELDLSGNEIRRPKLAQINSYLKRNTKQAKQLGKTSLPSLFAMEGQGPRRIVPGRRSIFYRVESRRAEGL